MVSLPQDAAWLEELAMIQQEGQQFGHMPNATWQDVRV